jgi:hypothetical protein
MLSFCGGTLSGWLPLCQLLWQNLWPHLVLALQILTRDSVTTQVDGVVYYRIYSAVSAVANVNDVHQATFLLAQTTLRNVLGTQTLSQILAGREEIAHSIQVKIPRTNVLHHEFTHLNNHRLSIPVVQSTPPHVYSHTHTHTHTHGCSREVSFHLWFHLSIIH